MVRWELVGPRQGDAGQGDPQRSGRQSRCPQGLQRRLAGRNGAVENFYGEVGPSAKTLRTRASAVRGISRCVKLELELTSKRFGI